MNLWASELNEIENWIEIEMKGKEWNSKSTKEVDKWFNQIRQMTTF